MINTTTPNGKAFQSAHPFGRLGKQKHMFWDNKQIEQMLTKQVLNCSFAEWYALFGHISIPSKSIKICEEFAEYLLSDGIVLPKGIGVKDEVDTECSEEWEQEVNDSEDEIEFAELEQQICETISTFGSVFPKLNWSSCEDSKWMSADGTRCRRSEDVYLLLKSSDRVVHDLTQPFKYCTDFSPENPPNVEYELILKKWIDMNPSMEFRCFIANNNLIAISQRDVRSYYQYIGQQKEDIIRDLNHFFVTHLKERFFDKNFVIDVYRPDRAQVVLVDVNPFGQLTDSLLFDWEELEVNLNNSDSDLPPAPEFRYLTNETGVQPKSYSMNALPIDVNYGYGLADVMNATRIDR